MKKKSTDIQGITREEYAYMDNIPLEGWIWEFVRRDPSFRSAFDTIKTVQAKHKVVRWPFPDGFLKADKYIGSIVNRGPFLDPRRTCRFPNFLFLPFLLAETDSPVFGVHEGSSAIEFVP